MVTPRTGVMHVLAGVLLDADGRVLLAQRPPGKQLAGLWEFPGGKREVGETPWQALARELREELDIGVQRAEPFVAIPWRHAQCDLLLDVWRVLAWDGDPRSAEGQALQWAMPAQVEVTILAGADQLVLRALLRA